MSDRWYIREDGKMVLELATGTMEDLPPLTHAEREKIRRKRANRHRGAVRAAKTKRELK